MAVAPYVDCAHVGQGTPAGRYLLGIWRRELRAPLGGRPIRRRVVPASIRASA